MFHAYYICFILKQYEQIFDKAHPKFYIKSISVLHIYL